MAGQPLLLCHPSQWLSDNSGSDSRLLSVTICLERHIAALPLSLSPWHSGDKCWHALSSPSPSDNRDLPLSTARSALLSPWRRSWMLMMLGDVQGCFCRLLFLRLRTWIDHASESTDFRWCFGTSIQLQACVIMVSQGGWGAKHVLFFSKSDRRQCQILGQIIKVHRWKELCFSSVPRSS